MYVMYGDVSNVPLSTMMLVWTWCESFPTMNSSPHVKLLDFIFCFKPMGMFDFGLALIETHVDRYGMHLRKGT